jgi:hypothetical protein
MRYTINTIVNGKAKAIPFKFSSKEDEQKYIDICEEIWGCVPIEYDWAIQTKPYKRKEEELKNNNSKI